MPILKYKQVSKVRDEIWSLIPVGVVVGWTRTLAEIPVRWGWQLADGTNGTPDLRDKFLKGASGDPGGTGGSATHTHADHAAQAHTGGAVADHPAQSHAGTSVDSFAGSTSNEVAGGAGGAFAGGFGAVYHTHTFNHSHSATDPLDHPLQSHTVTPNPDHPAQSHSTINHEPPYYKLVWIIRVEVT